MSPPSRRAIRKAINIIEDSKQSHIDVIEDPTIQIPGDKAFHKRCVAEYDQVLRVLRRVEEAL